MTATRRKRRTDGSGPVSSERIEQAAVELFGEKTYPVVSMRDLSDAVGLLPGSLYVHISSKEELLLNIVTKGIRRYLDEIGPVAGAGLPAPERLRGAIAAHLRVLAATPQQTRVAFNQWNYLEGPGRQQVIELREQYEALFSKILKEGIVSGEFRALKSPRIALLSLIGALNFVATWFSPDGEFTAEQIAEILTDDLLHGLRP